jgi:hypothetical protein
MLQLCYFSKLHSNLGTGYNDAVHAYLFELRYHVPFELRYRSLHPAKYFSTSTAFTRPTVRQDGQTFDDYVYDLRCVLQ